MVSTTAARDRTEKLGITFHVPLLEKIRGVEIFPEAHSFEERLRVI